MARFDYTKFLKEGGIEKYLVEADFGNDIEDRYEYIRPLMSRLPDSARTEALIDGMEDGLREDDKTMFDYYFVEAMKALGLESELMEADDSLINPEAEEIDAEDLDASADYFDSLAENDQILDEFLEMPAQEEEEEGEEVEIEKEAEVTININLEEGKFKAGDMVRLKNDGGVGPEFAVISTRRMFGSNLEAVRVTDENGKTSEYDETQLDLSWSPEQKANVFVREMEGEVQSEEVTVKPGTVQRGNIIDAIKLLNHIQYEWADSFSNESMESLSDVIVMLGQVLKTVKK